jgi:hypothetical protein
MAGRTAHLGERFRPELAHSKRRKKDKTGEACLCCAWVLLSFACNFNPLNWGIGVQN